MIEVDFDINSKGWLEIPTGKLGIEGLPEVFTVPTVISNTWIVMVVLMVISWLATRNLTSGPNFSRWQNLMEVIVKGARDQIKSTAKQDPKNFLPIIGTLFLFILVSNLMGLIPGFIPPTASILTTGAFGLMVFIAVPVFGIASQGLGKYLHLYMEPVWFMLPMNIIGEIARTLSISVRLFGNVLCGTVMGMIIVGLVPFFVPLLFSLLGLISGVIQAYIFAVLATVYIAASMAAAPEGASFEDAPLGAEIIPEADASSV